MATDLRNPEEFVPSLFILFVVSELPSKFGMASCKINDRLGGNLHPSQFLFLCVRVWIVEVVQ